MFRSSCNQSVCAGTHGLCRPQALVWHICSEIITLALAETPEAAEVHVSNIDAANTLLLAIEDDIVQGRGFSSVDDVDPAEVSV